MHMYFLSWLIWNTLEIFFKMCYKNLKHFSNISIDELKFFMFENSLTSSRDFITMFLDIGTVK